MQSSARIGAVIFDCDGVLIDSEALALEVETACLAEIGVAFELRRHASIYLGLTYLDALRELDAEVRKRTGRPLPSDFADRVRSRLRAVYEDRLQAVHGAAALLGALCLPKAVASSSSAASLDWKLAKVGLKAALGSHIYSSELVPHGKPAPDLFLLVARRLGVSPATVLVLEDSANGIRAAKAAGMVGAGFTGGGHCAPDHPEMLFDAGADLHFSSFAELAVFLANALV